MSTPAAQTGSVASETGSRDVAARDSHEEHAAVQHFFSQPTPHHVRDESDFDHDHDHDHDHEHGHPSKRGMHVTAAIALIGMLLIGGFLVYHKLLMPTPEEIAPAPVALPTPDMLRGAPVIEPTPPVVPAPAPQEVVPAPKLEAPSPSEPEVPAAEPAPAAQAAVSPEPAAEPAAAAPMPEGYARELAAARTAGFKKNAEQFYLRALAIAPDGAEALSGLAMYYLNQGKNQKAKERAEEAVKVDPKSSEGWIVLGASLAALGDGAGARKAYQECAQFEGKYMGECKRMLR